MRRFFVVQSQFRYYREACPLDVFFIPARPFSSLSVGKFGFAEEFLTTVVANTSRIKVFDPLFHLVSVTILERQSL